jgi:hypothetical protein
LHTKMCFHRQTLKRIGPDQPDPSERWRLKRSRILRGRQWGLIVLMGLLLFQCKGSEPQNLPFETIENADLIGSEVSNLEDKPRVVIITKTEQIEDKVGGAVSPEAQAQLRDLDFGTYFVIGVFQGRRPYLYTMTGVEVQRIEQRDHTITIFAHFYEPSGDQPRGMLVAPYHLLRIRKGESIRGELKFMLKADGKSVAREIESIP